MLTNLIQSTISNGVNLLRYPTSKLFIVSLLAMAIFGVGLLNFIPMNHSAQGHEACVAANALGAGACVPQDNEMCLDYHLGILSKLSQAVPNEGKLVLLALALLPIFAWFINRRPLLLQSFLHIKMRMKWLWEDLIRSYFKQMWFLILQEKRDLLALQLI